MIMDSCGRVVQYLRISVTDKCNLRCRYCSPVEEKYKPLEKSETMSYEDFLFIVSVFADMGVNRVRLTGGEPLVRKNLPHFIRNLSGIKGINEITLTTNGTLLYKYAQEIADAGIKRINISLDSLKPERYNKITMADNFSKVMEGIDLVRHLNFSPVKINVVVIKGFNDDEILDFCHFSMEKNVVVRFIEYMPIGNAPEWNKAIITGNEVLKTISSHYGVTDMGKSLNTGPAHKYTLSNGAEIGIITPISDHFCNSCDKLRLTADGKLRACLLSDEEVSVREAVKMQDREAIIKLTEEILKYKKSNHTIGISSNKHFERAMPRIGG